MEGYRAATDITYPFFSLPMNAASFRENIHATRTIQQLQKQDISPQLQGKRVLCSATASPLVRKRTTTKKKRLKHSRANVQGDHTPTSLISDSMNSHVNHTQSGPVDQSKVLGRLMPPRLLTIQPPPLTSFKSAPGSSMCGTPLLVSALYFARGTVNSIDT